MKTIQIIFACIFPKAKGKILKNTSNCIFLKKMEETDSTQWWYFAYLCCCFTSETFTTANRILTASESDQTREPISEMLEPIQKAHPYSVLHNHSQYQKYLAFRVPEREPEGSVPVCTYVWYTSICSIMYF